MSVLIKGMGMPRAGDIYSIQIFCYRGKVVCQEMLSGKTYPLVEVPPHGRLIDADPLIDEYENLKQRRGKEKMNEGMTFELVIDGIVYDLKNAPTVIEAEGLHG